MYIEFIHLSIEIKEFFKKDNEFIKFIKNNNSKVLLCKIYIITHEKELLKRKIYCLYTEKNILIINTLYNDNFFFLKRYIISYATLDYNRIDTESINNYLLGYNSKIYNFYNYFLIFKKFKNSQTCIYIADDKSFVNELNKTNRLIKIKNILHKKSQK
jgi:hypothetical protein